MTAHDTPRFLAHGLSTGHAQACLRAATSVRVRVQRTRSKPSYSITLGDLNGDQHLDAFVTNILTPDKVWINDGNGQFNDSGQALTSTYATHAALGDLDGDGDLDVMVAITFESFNTVLFNDGNGTLTDSGQALGDRDSQWIALGDLDGDGDLDAMVANTDDPDTVWFNDGNGVFTNSGQELEDSLSYSVALGDLDGDGDLDAAVSNASLDSNRIWFNDSSGTFVDSKQDLGFQGAMSSLWTTLTAMAISMPWSPTTTTSQTPSG